MIKTKKESPEVLYSLNKYTTLTKKDLLTLGKEFSVKLTVLRELKTKWFNKYIR